ncbi:cystinosin homolog [Ziziphus jujuba]|uniref:Cystinosin homolog n=1 Tax=Ziziphus jujuba TaxID=326968 RepID=A0A6P3ZKA4_ZIZJJ|nr:cystinosin homolog [Ziziphus jujuba]
MTFKGKPPLALKVLNRPTNPTVHINYEDERSEVSKNGVNKNTVQNVCGCIIVFLHHIWIRCVVNPGTQWVVRKTEQNQMASWNSIPLEITYRVFGWIAFFCWAVGGYPQVILNFRRKSVVGLNFDFVVLNLTKHSSYLIYNATLYFSSTVQNQYLEKYGFQQMIPVALNDVIFSAHAVLLTIVGLFQIAIYERGAQRVSKISIAIVGAAWFMAGVCFFIALPTHSWLWLISIFNSIQVFMTLIKYIPQALMNFMRKSTTGFSIGGILFDFSGGVTNFSQMAVQSIDQGSWVNLYGNVGKTMISLISIFFDLIFMAQHYLLYSSNRALIPPPKSSKEVEPLVKSSSDHLENV